MQTRPPSQGEFLELQAERGLVRFAGSRFLLLDAAALWALRLALVDVIGLEATRGVLTQFGFAHGWRTAVAVEGALEGGREAAADAFLPVHVLQGLFAAPEASAGPLSDTGTTLIHAFEAEQRLLERGFAAGPVCWTLCGIISGYLSRATGHRVYALEDRCAAQGDAACHVRARTREQWGEARAAELEYFDARRPDDAALDDPEATVGSSSTGAQDSLEVARRAERSAMGMVLELTRRVAPSEATVLVTGESGVGKERIARLLHDWSSRAAGPFIAVNCGAMTESLLDSELFGHARGAFTGAVQDHEGLFEAASGGTLLLDEIGDVSPSMQVKLLRVLQEREIRRVGESKNRPVDVRLVGATNQELGSAVSAGRFRSDLYYRLNVVELHVPPLRARQGEIIALAQTLLGEAARRMKRKIEGFSPAAVSLLVDYRWPGNVRELENVMERAVALAMGTRVEVADLPDDVRYPSTSTSTSTEHDSAEVRPLRAIEKDYILASLERNDGNQTHTAQQLEIGTATLYRKLKKYGVLPARPE